MNWLATTIFALVLGFALFGLFAAGYILAVLAVLAR